ncbi:MAG: hypothetical protein ACI959_002125, partial [Limisphaerales bacterium]
KFEAQHPSVSIAGEFDFELDNNGESFGLYDRFGYSLEFVIYQDDIQWLEGADGYGRTLEREFPAGDPTESISWFNGCMGGSPGSDWASCQDPIIISEINYNSSISTNPEDWIELWNTTTSSIDISGWVFKDEKDYHAYQLGDGISLTADQRIVLCADTTLFKLVYSVPAEGPFDFGLSDGGEGVRIYNKEEILQYSAHFVDSLPFPIEADGTGPTLEFGYPDGGYGPRVYDHSNWFAGCPQGSPGTAYDPTCGAMGLVDQLALNVALRNNPATTHAILDFSGNSNANWELIDLSGNRYDDGMLHPGVNYLDRKTLTAGYYLIKVYQGELKIVLPVIFTSP